jgi:ferredoxin like protein
MSHFEIGSVPDRLSRNAYIVDDGTPHISVNQEAVRASGAGKLLVHVCPARVYTEEVDGTVGVEYAACLECGTCLAVAPAGALEWHYPASLMGIQYREG